MKHASRLFAFCVLLCALPLQSLAAELEIRNAGQCGAKVSLAYQREGASVVEGWHKLAPGQALTVRLFAVGENDVYAHVIFEYPAITQLTEKDTPTAEHFIQDTHFRYIGTPADNPALRKAMFQRVPSQKQGTRDDGDWQEDRSLLLILRSAVN